MLLSALVESSSGGLQPLTRLVADPPVGAVVTTDLLDPGRYLSGGELVLTGLAWWRPDAPERSRAFVAALVGAGAVALAAGEAELGVVPADLVSACTEAGLPLLRVPVAYSFADLTTQASRLLAGRADLAGLLARHRAMVRAAAAPDAGLSTVLDLVAAELGAAGWVLSPTGRLVHGPALEPRERRALARNFLRAAELPTVLARPGGRFVTLYGDPTAQRAATWLLALGADRRRWSVDQQAVVEELAALVAVEHGLTVRRSAAEQRLAAGLTGADPSEVEAAVRLCGLDPTRPMAVVVGTGGPVVAVLLEALADQPAGWALGPVDTGSGGALAVVCDPADLVGALRARLAALGPGLGPDPVLISVSDPVAGGSGLLAAVAEARYAMAGAGPGVVGPDRLSSHSALLGAIPAELRRAYQGRVLGPLLEHDRVHRTELVHTLAAYLACSGSWSRCAAQMHVHVNTLRYRIERIEALTGRDLRQLGDQVDLVLALAATDPPHPSPRS